ncbi:hypothetical protein M8J76_002122 [Diaphorina citri]|nr:hypothetical protein M8J75_003452 [Diaphorina citri]KAI5744423.1 hypothetical protein M8J76_002122 [Diaphorina citri]
MYGHSESTDLEHGGSFLQSHWEQDKNFDHRLRTSYEKYAEKQHRLDVKLKKDLDFINARYAEAEVLYRRRMKEVDLRAAKLRSMTVYTPAERALENAKKTYQEQLEKIRRKSTKQTAAQIKPRKCYNAARQNKESSKYEAKTIKLSNNLLTGLTGIEVFIQEILASPSNLTWLDLSFNQLQRLNGTLSPSASLTILYLHGNKLQSLSDILNTLIPLQKLTHLTLSGNPLETINPQYKSKIITTLQTVTHLDFALVTKWERQVALDRKRCVTVAKQTLKRKPIKHYFI